MMQFLINQMNILYFLFSREKSKYVDYIFKFDGIINRNKLWVFDVLYFIYNRNKYLIFICNNI